MNYEESEYRAAIDDYAKTVVHEEGVSHIDRMDNAKSRSIIEGCDSDQHDTMLEQDVRRNRRVVQTFENQAAQGDVVIRRVEEVPADARQVEPVEGKYILAHSETGHHHTVKARTDIRVFETDDPFKAYIELGGDPADLEHERSFDTHGTIRIPSGVFELRRQREYTPEGYRRAAD